MTLGSTQFRPAIDAGCAMLLVASFLPACANGQEANTAVPYRHKEITLAIAPEAEVRYSQTKFVQVRSPKGKPQVARLICHVDDDIIIERPAGELVLVPHAESRPSDSKMSRVTKDDVEHALRESGIEGYKQVWDKPYLYVYDCSEPFFEYTRTIVKSMYPGIVGQLKEWDLDIHRPDVPLIIVIAPDRQTFDKLKALPPEVAAYYNVISNHVILYEDKELADAAPEFGLKQAAYTIVHECVHQLLANTGVEQRLTQWPMWISEGIPEYLCPLRVKSKVVRKKTAQLPIRDVRWVESGMLNDLRMYSLLKMRGGRGDLIRNTATATELDGDGYAVAWGMVHHLATNEPDAFKAYLKDIAKQRPLANLDPDHQERLEQTFVKHFSDNYRTIERAVQKHLTSKRMRKSTRIQSPTKRCIW